MKIACLLDTGFEDSEFKEPYERFREAGHEVTIIGLEGGKELEGYRGKVTTRSEKSLDDLRPQDFDALFLPGGQSPDHLRADPRAVEWVRHFMESDKPSLVICHGPQLLMTAGTVAGRRLTAWKTVQGDLRYTGADVVDEEVVVDGNLVTSRQPQDLPKFVEASLDLLERVPTSSSRSA